MFENCSKILNLQRCLRARRVYLFPLCIGQLHKKATFFHFSNSVAVVNEKGRGGGVCQSVKRMSTGLMFFRLLALIFVANKIFFVKAIFCFHCNLFPHESATVCPGNKVVNFGWQFDVSHFEEKNILI